jgi:hypothetical protein
MTMHLVVCPYIPWIDSTYYMKRFTALWKITVYTYSTEHIIAQFTIFLELPWLYRPYYYTSQPTLKIFINLWAVWVILCETLISDCLKMYFLDPIDTSHMYPCWCRRFRLIPKLNQDSKYVRTEQTLNRIVFIMVIL